MFRRLEHRGHITGDTNKYQLINDKTAAIFASITAINQPRRPAIAAKTLHPQKSAGTMSIFQRKWHILE